MMLKTVNDLSPGYVLLMNARVQKGFDILLAAAERLPHIPFVAVASQSNGEDALASVAAAGLRNVTIIERTDDTDTLYRKARVVLVPSYRFYETFSRVCIETQRYGLPVIGCDTGNVPFLLETSGLVLPNDPDLWAQEIGRLYADEAYFAARSERALENSKRYSQAAQQSDFDRLVTFTRSPILIGIGSGIGNMLHVGPMIRNVSRRLGQRVDLVVSEDHSESLFLLHDPEYVNAVHSLRPAILDKRYDTVFLTHSFGGTRVNFAADRIVWSRDWDLFVPGQSPHETIFNLEAAKELLGIDYEPEDIHAHYVSDIEYEWSDGPVIGIHGGSKGSYWASKRWTRFSQLVEALKERGYRVLSFGLSEEYVEGAEDMTGGTIEEMVLKMRGCSYFISNDSGLMNIANALGIPTVAIFGPTDPGTRAPLSPRSIVVAARTPCAPCEVTDRERFKSGECSCIDTIALAEVLDAFDRLLSRVLDESPQRKLSHPC